MALLFGIYYVIKQLDNYSLKKIFKAIPALFGMGFISQISNVAQLLNYRFNYFLIEKFWGSFGLGRYVVSMQVSESVWIVSRSIALVQYSEISNASDYELAIKRTLFFVRWIFLLSLTGMLIISCIPSSLFQKLLGQDFMNLSKVFIALLPGIVLLACSHPLSAFFSGTGKIYINMYGSLLGLIVTIGLGLFLVPKWGIIGAAITNSCSYMITFGFSLYKFTKITHTHLKDLLFHTSDWKMMRLLIRKILKKSKF